MNSGRCPFTCPLALSQAAPSPNTGGLWATAVPTKDSASPRLPWYNRTFRVEARAWADSGGAEGFRGVAAGCPVGGPITFTDHAAFPLTSSLPVPPKEGRMAGPQGGSLARFGSCGGVL